MKSVADSVIVRPIGYVLRKLGRRPDVLTRLWDMAIEDSAQYYLDNMPNALRFNDRYPLFDHSLSKARPDGLIMEFGSYKGKSLRYLAPRVGCQIHGFDSFEGLQEDWAGSIGKGHFNVNGKLPKVPGNVVLHKGWFQDTLPSFLAEHPGPISFLHMDADTYESTAYVLDQCRDRITPGTVIQFDEYFGYPGWRANEFRAFQEFAANTGLTYRYLGFGFLSVAVLITG